MGRAGRAYPSLASAKWRAETAAALRRLIRHVQQSDYARQVFGYMVTGLMTEEWYHWSIHTNELSDYSPRARRAFGQWLRAKYGTARALQRAWNAPEADFAGVAVPSQHARQRGRNERTFRDPATDMPVIDWYLFYNDLIPETIDLFCRAAKEACQFRKVVGAFYCYMFEFGGDPEYGHNGLARLLRSPNLDFALVTASYHDRALGRGADYERGPITSLRLHGKLWYHDNDTVSFRYDAMNLANPDRALVARYRQELGVTESARETIWQYRRGAGFVLGNGVFQAFFDLHGGYFDAPQLMAEVRRLNRVFDDAAARDCSSVAEILVVTDETSCSYATFESGFLQQTLQPAQVQLARLGAPHDSILLDDLDRLDLRRHKLVVFLNCFHLTDAQRRLVRRRVLNRNRTVLWCYAPGYFNGPRPSLDAARELTGFRLGHSPAAGPMRLRIALTEAGLALMGDGSGRGTASGPPVGHEHVWGDLFFVDDPQATALGRVESRNEVALALKRLDGWTSVYTVNPVLPSRLLRALARDAGAHIYCDSDDVLYASRSYLTLAVDHAGKRVVSLPRRCDVFDPAGGEPLWRGVTRIERDFQPREVVTWRLSGAAPGS
jgi:hypothetical protein